MATRYFEIINELANDIFVIQDIYSYKEKLKIKHLKNNNIEAKIRQILQQLRDMGFIKFVNKGIYKKMWIDKSKIERIKMKYIDQLNFAKKEKINITKLFIAYEV